MKRAKWLGFFLITGFLISLTALCSKDNPVANGGVETGNAKVIGELKNPDGSPAKNAKVHLIPVNYDPHSIAKRLAKTGMLNTAELRQAILAEFDSATTNDSGQYSFDSTTAAGIYNVLADSGSSKAAFQDSVTIPAGDTQTTVPTDTLKSPGSLRGVIRLQPSDDSRTVFVIALGTNAFTSPSNAVGDFSLANMAEGTYRVRLLSTIDKYIPLDTFFSITSGTDGVLADTIYLPLKIPTPTGLTIHYDTLKQIVTLSWDRVDTTKVNAYNVYRKNVRVDSAEAKMTAVPLQDTVFVDSTGIQDETYIYRVSSVNASEEEGAKMQGDTVTVVSAFEVVDSVGSAGTADGQFTIVRDLCFDKNGNLYVVSHETGTSDNPKVQKFDNSFNFVLSLGSKGTATSQFNEPWGIAVDTSMNIYVADRGNGRIQVFSPSGIFTDSFSTNLQEPTGVLVTENAIYVADYSSSQYYSTIKKFDLQGNYLLQWGEKGDGDGQFRMIWSLKETSAGEIVALDENGLQFFTPSGQFIKSFALSRFGTYNPDFDIADSTIYIATSSGNSDYGITMINLTGEIIGKMRYNQNIFQIAVKGNIFASDFDESKIRVFANRH